MTAHEPRSEVQRGAQWRLVIPVTLRKALKLQPGDRLVARRVGDSPVRSMTTEPIVQAAVSHPPGSHDYSACIAAACERFAVDAAGGRAHLPGCVMSFSYWNPAMLRQAKLLNAQTGELVAVRLELLGEEFVAAPDAPLTARRYALHVPGLRIDVWYADGGRWVQLESRTGGGRLLRYLIQ